MEESTEIEIDNALSKVSHTCPSKQAKYHAQAEITWNYHKKRDQKMIAFLKNFRQVFIVNYKQQLEERRDLLFYEGMQQFYNSLH